MKYPAICILTLLGLANVQANVTLSEWSADAKPEIPRHVFLYVKEDMGVSANMRFDPRKTAPNGSGAIQIEVVDPGDSSVGNIYCLFSYPEGIESGKRYRVTMVVSATQNVQIGMRALSDEEGCAVLGTPEAEKFDIGTEWKKISYVFTGNDSCVAGEKVRVPNLSGMGLFEGGTSLFIASWKFEELN